MFYQSRLWKSLFFTSSLYPTLLPLNSRFLFPPCSSFLTRQLQLLSQYHILSPLGFLSPPIPVYPFPFCFSFKSFFSVHTIALHCLCLFWLRPILSDPCQSQLPPCAIKTRLLFPQHVRFRGSAIVLLPSTHHWRQLNLMAFPFPSNWRLRIIKLLQGTPEIAISQVQCFHRKQWRAAIRCIYF